MPTDPQMTQRFEISPYLVMTEGEAHSLALLIGMAYSDPHISRDEWSISHALKSRKDLIAELRTQGEKRVRVGIAADSEKVVEQLRRRAEALGVQFHMMRTGTKR